MKWINIKQSIIDHTDNLKQPARRLSALYNVESLLQQYFPKYIATPCELKNITKEELITQMGKKRKKKLNDAEICVMNFIYKYL